MNLARTTCLLVLIAAVATGAETPKGGKTKPAVAGAVARGQTLDLVGVFDAKHAVRGTWRVTGNELHAADGETPARLVLPVAPGDVYSLKVEFTRTEDEGLVGFVLPVGNRQCLLALNVKGTANGLELVDGRGAAENATTVAAALAPGRRVSLEISVRVEGKEASITTTLDDRPFVFYRGPTASLGLPKDYVLPQKNALGLIATPGTVFHKLRFRAASAGARKLD